MYRGHAGWQKPRTQAALVLELSDAAEFASVVCFSPKQLELLSPDGLRRHPWLGGLGPDLLANDFDVNHAVAQLRQANGLPVGEAIMTQSLVCGIGNVYKSEGLFLAAIHPATTVGTISDDDLAALLSQVRVLMLRNLDGYPRRTRFEPGPSQWVYGRRGERCLKCGERIRLLRQGELPRSSYWCPVCQPKPHDFGKPKPGC